MGADSVTNPIEAMRQVLTGIYAAANSDQAFLAFEVAGIPVDDSMVKLRPTDTAFNQQIAIESVSRLANQAPRVSGGLLSRGLASIDGMLEVCLDGSRPAGADEAAALGAVKGPAQDAFQTTLPSMLGELPGPAFRPAYASPPDWYDPAVAGNWTVYGSSQQQGTSPPEGAAPSGAAGTPAGGAAAQAGGGAKAAAGGAGTPATGTGAPRPVWRVLAAPGTVSVAPAMPAVERPAVLTRSAVVRRDLVQHDAVLRVRTAPAAAGAAGGGATTSAGAAAGVVATQPVDTQSITLDFEYCLVTLDRPWLPEAFLALRDWYLTGYARGEISAGTGAADATGVMPLLARGFLAVRNLELSADWQEQDRRAAVSQPLGFGPFTLAGSRFDSASGRLSCPGTQIIGWFCAAFPALPPVSDPSLAAATPAAPGAPAPAAPAAAESAAAAAGPVPSGSPAAGGAAASGPAAPGGTGVDG